MRLGKGRCRAILAAAVCAVILAAALPAPLSALANGPGSSSAAPVTADADIPMRIGLGWGLTSAEVSAPGGLHVVEGSEILAEVAPGQAAAARLVNGLIQVNDLPPRSGPIRLVPLQQAAPNYITFKGKPYRGEIELVIGESGRLSVVNVVNLEEYLLGLVPNEMPHTWPMEALKAQAVAARTYALTNRGKQKAEGFDLRATPDDQAYGGVLAERESTTRAVEATRGQVVTYQGRMVATYYHSSSGGHTENNENYWVSGAPIPYLRGVVDYDNVPDYGNVKGNPYYSWTYRFTAEEFAQKLKQAGFDVGQVTAVIPGPPGASGRPVRWQVTGTTGEATLTMAQMRTALGLRAAPRAIEPQFEEAPAPATPVPPPAPVYVVGAGGRGTARPLEGSYAVGGDGELIRLPAGTAVVQGASVVGQVGNDPPTPPPTPAPAPSRVAAFEVRGGGNGHAVGLSQWGAHGMALQGKNYIEILTHFYTGTKVETLNLETLGL